MKKEKLGSERMIIGFEDYTITDNGSVYSYKGKVKRELSLRKSTNKYYYVDLSANGITKRFLVHRLVAKHFIVNSNNFNEVNHKDGNVFNNHYTNLEWCTHYDNMQHAFKNKLHRVAIGEKTGASKLTDKFVVEARNLYSTGNYTFRYLASTYNVNHATMRSAILGLTWKHI